MILNLQLQIKKYLKEVLIIKLKIIKNPNWSEDKHIEFSNAIKAINGQCPCVLPSMRTQNTLCMCKEFREQKSEEECHCGKYIKVLIED